MIIQALMLISARIDEALRILVPLEPILAALEAPRSAPAPDPVVDSPEPPARAVEPPEAPREASPVPTRVCKGCGVTYVTTNPRSEFHDRQCGRDWHSRNRKHKRAAAVPNGVDHAPPLETRARLPTLPDALPSDPPRPFIEPFNPGNRADPDPRRAILEAAIALPWDSE